MRSSPLTPERLHALQEKELELLHECLRICRELNLTCFLVCGSALGAAKYSGFIPWDDDIDIALPRRDYERFIAEAPAHLQSHYFLQNAKTDPAFPLLYSKLRNSNTTYIETTAAELPIHHGIYIDIFPLDGYPGSRLAQMRLEFLKKLYLTQSRVVFNADGRRLHSRMLAGMWRLLGYHRRTAKTIAKLNRLLAAYPIEGSALICNHGNWQGRLEYAPASQYGDGVHMSFHDLDVLIPADYEAYLSQKYGAWHEELPEDQKVGHHYFDHFDPDRPYTQYFGLPAGAAPAEADPPDTETST